MRSLIAITVLSSALPLDAATPCEELSKLRIERATITTAESIAAGSFKPPEGAAVKVTTGFCRVAMVLKPSSDSDIQVEVWLPSTGWNSKFQGVGNGGFAGAIGYGAMAAAVAHG